MHAAREYRRGGWVFTGFHWPVLAGHLAYSLPGERFNQVLEAGATLHGSPQDVPTSTTDYAAYADQVGYAGDSGSVLLSMARRLDRVILDAGNIDLLGRVNSTLIGPQARPIVRLPGGGGAADVAAVARELIWLHGGANMSRLQRRVEHVTASPGPATEVRLHTRWGVLALGESPALTQLADVDGCDAFVRHLQDLGVPTAGAVPRIAVGAEERRRAAEVLQAAARRGYVVARQAAGEVLAASGIGR